MQTKSKKVRMVILLASIWFVISLPLPWLVGNPDVPESQFYTILGIIGVTSIPFVVLGIVWTIKPELTT
jgi:membrane protein DedA with SNARE-associated domain